MSDPANFKQHYDAMDRELRLLAKRTLSLRIAGLKGGNMSGPSISFSDGLLTILAADPRDGYFIHQMEADMRAEGFEPKVHTNGGVSLTVRLMPPLSEIVGVPPGNPREAKLVAAESLLAAKAKLQQKETEQRILGAIGSFTTREHGGL